MAILLYARYLFGAVLSLGSYTRALSGLPTPCPTLPHAQKSYDHLARIRVLDLVNLAALIDGRDLTRRRRWN